MSRVLYKNKVDRYQEMEGSIPDAHDIVKVIPSRLVVRQVEERNEAPLVETPKKPRLKKKVVEPVEKRVPKCHCCGTQNNVLVSPMCGWMCGSCARDGGYL